MSAQSKQDPATTSKSSSFFPWRSMDGEQHRHTGIGSSEPNCSTAAFNVVAALTCETSRNATLSQHHQNQSPTHHSDPLLVPVKNPLWARRSTPAVLPFRLS
ncbi:MAG: hypothetical protein OXC62_17115 [Aestuariivita sp.]|nr:hypothetical protein [Aestuariivita sp.]